MSSKWKFDWIQYAPDGGNYLQHLRCGQLLAIRSLGANACLSGVPGMIFHVATVGEGQKRVRKSLKFVGISENFLSGYRF